MIEMHHKTRWTTTSALAAALICSCVGSAARGQDSKTGEAITKPSKVLPVAGEVFWVKGHTAFLILPKQVAAGGKTPWVW